MNKPTQPPSPSARRRIAHAGLSILLWQSAAAFAAPMDLFNTDALVSNAVSHGIDQADGASGCDAAARPEQSLTLASVIDFALCRNPQTQRAWANAKLQAAQVGLAKAAYLPSLNASAGYQRQRNVTRVDNQPVYDQDVDSSLRTNRIDLNLVLFDFGARSANLESARALMNAANLTQDATLQAVFIGAAQSYYDATTAQSSVLAIRSSRHSAEESFHAAEARFNIGLGTMVEKLQSETAFAQESLKLVKAEGALNNALGDLAAVMGFAANTALKLDGADDEHLPDIAFVKSIEVLMEEAKTLHPGLAAARAQLLSAQAGEKIARASGLPTISLTASNTRATQPSLQLGLPPLTTNSRSTQYGLQLNMPLGDEFSRAYRIRQASAQTESKAADLAEVELQVSVAVWKSFQALQTATEELKVSEQYRFSAAKTVDASRGRYLAGATEILELLNAQATLANAEQTRIQALADWRLARLRLAYSLGKLGSLKS